MQRTKNIMEKYLKRQYLWNRQRLTQCHRISEWRLGDKVVKVYERKEGNEWTPIHNTSYVVTD